MKNKKYIVGSKLLNLNNIKDIDYLEFDKNVEYERAYQYGIDTVKVSKKELKKVLKFKVDLQKYYWRLIFNYQLDKRIIEKDFPIKYNLLKYKKQLIELLNFIVDKKLMNFNARVTIDEKHCSKVVYHVAYNLFILKNNEVKLTDEQLEIIQKIHDGKMPIEYLDELKKLLIKINEERK